MIPDPLIGQILADRYRVIRVLGEGGMGRVYLAEHVRMGRMSAVKVMTPSLVPTDDSINRFNREAANASRINHPNVAAIYDYGETAEGVLYLAMEYVEGETLAALLRQSGPLPVDQVSLFIQQIANALQAAHQLGIVHRDLKPDNILIGTDADGEPRVKVVDFGIAKSVQGGGGQTLTTVGMSVGTPEFMSPEQLAGEQLDFRTDIYSLGLVAFTMLTNELAYPSSSSKHSLVQRLTNRPRPLTDARPTTVWPAQLQAALDKATSPEPADRYARAVDFAVDVRAAVDHIVPIDDARTRAMTALAPAIAITRITAADAAPARSNRKGIAVAATLVVAAGAVFALTQSSTSPTRAPASAASVPASDSATVASPVAAPANPPSVAAAPPASPPAPSRSNTSRQVPTARVSSSKAAVVPPAAVDSPAVAPPVSDISTGRGVRHAWLRASGDSALAPLDAGTPLSDATREVLGHIARARKLFANGQPAKAAPELRTASEELAVFATEHPGARETMMLRQQFGAVVRQALAECHAARGSAPAYAPIAPMCAGLETAARNLPQGRGAAGQFPGPRRNNRPRVVP